MHHPTTREGILGQVAEELGVTEGVIERALYADLQDAYILERFEDIEAEALLHRYDLALAQAVLFRASRIPSVAASTRRQAAKAIDALSRLLRNRDGFL